MQKKINYTVLGVLVVSLSVVLVAFFFWLYAGYRVMAYHTYKIVTSDIGSLEVDQDVRYSGVKVGYIDSISIPDPKKPGRVEILFRVDNSIVMTTSTYATFGQAGLTGPAYLSLNRTSELGTLLKAQPGQHYPEVPLRASGLSSVMSKLPGITTNIEKSSGGLKSILTKENADNVSATVKNIRVVTGVVAAQEKQINKTLMDLQYSMGKIKKISDEMPVVVSKVEKTLDSVKALSTTSNHAVRNFSQQSMPQVSELLQRLNTLTLQVNQLASQLKHEPSSLVRGRLITSLGPGEA